MPLYIGKLTNGVTSALLLTRVRVVWKQDVDPKARAGALQSEPTIQLPDTLGNDHEPESCGGTFPLSVAQLRPAIQFVLDARKDSRRHADAIIDDTDLIPGLHYDALNTQVLGPGMGMDIHEQVVYHNAEEVPVGCDQVFGVHFVGGADTRLFQHFADAIQGMFHKGMHGDRSVFRPTLLASGADPGEQTFRVGVQLFGARAEVG